jgi:hypothetical protein
VGFSHVVVEAVPSGEAEQVLRYAAGLAGTEERLSIVGVAVTRAPGFCCGVEGWTQRMWNAAMRERAF